MSDIKITYNNKTIPPPGTGPTPYLSLSDQVISYGDRWGLAHRITLNGQITGLNYDALYSAQTGLVDCFYQSYKTLTVSEATDDQNDYSGVFSFSGCSVEGIRFDNGPYNKIASYSVDLVSYPSGLTGYFSGTYGVLDPKDDFKISPGNDGFATITHSVEARAFVISSIDDAINNAKNFVSSKTGIAKILSLPLASGISNTGSFTPVLINLAENLDRLGLRYSVEETYKFKLISGDSEAGNNYSFNNYYLTSYSTSLNSGAGDDFVTASIQGEIKAGITGATGDALVSGLINQLSGLNPYSIISGKYGAPNGFSFCQDPIQLTISEDLKARKINFNASYDNLEFYNSANDYFVYSGCYFDPTITYNIDELSNITTIEIRGDIKSRGSVSHRYNNSLEYLGQLMNSSSEPSLYGFANSLYTGYLATQAPLFALNKSPSSLEIQGNPLLGTVSVNASFNNKDSFFGLTNMDYNIEYTPYNTIYAYASSCNEAKKHLAVNVNVKKREKAALDLTISSPGSGESELISTKDNIFSKFISEFIAKLNAGGTTLDTVQEESSVLSISNSPVGDSFTSNKYGSTVNASKVYSYELLESEAGKRIIIKS